MHVLNNLNLWKVSVLCICRMMASSSGVKPSSIQREALKASLELGDLQGRRAEEVQEERSFLFGQEGGGHQVVEAGRDLV